MRCNRSAVALSNAIEGANLKEYDDQIPENVVKRYEEARDTRKQLLSAIQIANSEEWIGLLLHANEEMVKALQKFHGVKYQTSTNEEEMNGSNHSDLDDDVNPFSDVNEVKQAEREV